MSSSFSKMKKDPGKPTNPIPNTDLNDTKEYDVGENENDYLKLKLGLKT